MNYRITLPEQYVDRDVLERLIKKMLKEDFDKDGILAKVFILTYLNQPISVTELTKKFNDYFKTDFDRSAIRRAVDKLVEKYIVNRIKIVELLTNNPEDLSEMEQRTLEKYRLFQSTIPQPFRNRFTEIKYFWVSNGDGLKYIEWCCKILNFKCEQQ